MAHHASPPAASGDVRKPNARQTLERSTYDSTQGGLASMDACVSSSGALNARKRKKNAHPEGICSWVVRHQIGLSASLLSLQLLAHTFIPQSRAITRPFTHLSYYNPSTGLYNQGRKDFAFVLYWVAVFTGLREATMTYLLVPTARLCGLRKPKMQIRFSEQAWLLLYYMVFWTVGMYVMYNSNYWMNLKELWTEFPRRDISGLFKWYYLAQLAFWLQQILVVNIEKRRKDHWQMFTHHIVTSALIVFSYGYYQTKVGNLVLCLMDVVDLTLPIAKMLRYMRWQVLCDIVFGIFIASWFLARHLAYLAVCWSVVVDVPLGMPAYGCFSSNDGSRISTIPPGSTSPGGSDILSNVLQPFIDPGGEICFNPRIRYTFLALLLFLQGITIMWFVLIVKIAYRVIMGQGAGDDRSDDEDDKEEEEVDDTDEPIDALNGSPALPMQPIEQLVGAEGLKFNGKSSPVCRSRKPGGSSSATAMAIAGHRKEILNRIGCDKPSE